MTVPPLLFAAETVGIVGDCVLSFKGEDAEFSVDICMALASAMPKHRRTVTHGRQLPRLWAMA
jgi:hypothetical protein